MPLSQKLKSHGLRPTRQRLALANILFAKEHRHVTAESLFEEAAKAYIPVSLATVYNTLNQFKDAGLLREVAIEGAKTYFDTNVSSHHHFYMEDEQKLFDIPTCALQVTNVPKPPAGMEIDRIDVVVRLKRK